LELSKDIFHRSVEARVDRTIDLDRESKLVTVEIDNVATHHLLAAKLQPPATASAQGLPRDAL
jgi:hypothetical protein